MILILSVLGVQTYYKKKSACGVMVTIIGNGHSDPSSKLGEGCLHVTSC